MINVEWKINRISECRINGLLAHRGNALFNFFFLMVEFLVANVSYVRTSVYDLSFLNGK